MKKKVVCLLMSAALAASVLSGCGGAKEDASKETNKEQEVVQQTEDDFVEEEMVEEADSYYGEVCAMYYDYLTGGLSEDEFAELLESLPAEITMDMAKEIFEENAGLYGFSEPVVYEPTSEIMNARADATMIQIGDVVVQFPCTFGDFMEAVNGEFGDKDEASSSDRAMSYYRKQFSLDTDFQTLDTLRDYGIALVKTSDGSFLILGLQSNDKSVQAAKDLYITSITTGSSNVLFPGGIHTGMSMQEMDEILAEIEDEFNPWGWKSSSDTSDLYNQFDNRTNGRCLYFKLDGEKNQLWYMVTRGLPAEE